MKRLIIAGAILSAAALGYSAFASTPHAAGIHNQGITVSDTIPGQRMDSTTHRYNPTDSSMRRDSILSVR